MSILKFVPQYSRSLEDMITYLCAPEKTSADLIMGIGINPQHPIVELKLASDLWNCNETNRPYFQVILSFDANVKSSVSMDIIKEIAFQVGKMFSMEHQILSVIHTDTDNLHIHYLINSPNVITGKQFRQKKSLYSYKQRINELLINYSLSPIYCFTGQTLY